MLPRSLWTPPRCDGLRAPSAQGPETPRAIHAVVATRSILFVICGSVQQNHAQVGRTEEYNKRSHCSDKARCETQPDNTTREPSAVLVHAVSHHTHEACVVCGCSTSDGRQPGADRWAILRNQKLRVRASWGRWMLNFENSKAMRAMGVELWLVECTLVYICKL